jgi:addiction module RelE/StbE family toxin
VKLVWSKAAVRDLEELAVYIAEDSEQAAEFVEERIREEAKLLSRAPHSGRIGRVHGTRERVVRRTPYILAYRIVPGRVRILRVYHGARQWPSRFE